jgi:hypothetical protein
MERPSATGAPHDRLISGLTADLRPVRRLPAPTLRALAWLGFVLAVAVALAAFADLPSVWRRLTGAPDMTLAVAGSTATTVLAAIAAFELSLPDARRAWALLPLPAALLWIAASGVGCLRAWVLPATHTMATGETGDCLMFIIAFSVPFSGLMILMLRRACPLEPGLTAAVAGLAAAAAAATLLNFFHPFDAALTDLAVHAAAVALVIAVNRALARRTLALDSFSRDVTAGPEGAK